VGIGCHIGYELKTVFCEGLHRGGTVNNLADRMPDRK
jgi:hypothetical protein